VNLLSETLSNLLSNGKSPADVFWVGSKDGEYAISWEEFAKIANVDYHKGFGGQAVASDLVVVGQSWWLERGEYDGSEWWEFKSTPVKLNDCSKFHTVCNNGMWASLEEMNRPGGKYHA